MCDGHPKGHTIEVSFGFFSTPGWYLGGNAVIVFLVFLLSLVPAY